MHEIIHFLVGAPGTGFNAVTLQRLGGTASGLIKSGNEALAAGHAFKLFLVHIDLLLSSVSFIITKAVAQTPQHACHWDRRALLYR